MDKKRAHWTGQRCIALCFLAAPLAVWLLPHGDAYRSRSSSYVPGHNPWELLHLPPPNPSGSKTLMLADVRKAFRKVAKKAHPDAGGSEQQFRLLVWAYNEIVEKTANANAEPAQRARDSSNKPSWAGGKAWSSDGFVEDWAEQHAADSALKGLNVGVYGNAAMIEAETDDDGWGGREALRDYFVKKHDALIEGNVNEGDLAIYRLASSINGRFWGVGEVYAMQTTYTHRHTGPAGRMFLHPLRKDVSIEGVEGDYVRLVLDDCAEIATTRVLDRFELLQEGVERSGEHQFIISKGTESYTRLTSGKVHLAECDFEEECEMPASECIYCYGDECQFDLDESDQYEEHEQVHYSKEEVHA